MAKCLPCRHETLSFSYQNPCKAGCGNRYTYNTSSPRARWGEGNPQTLMGSASIKKETTCPKVERYRDGSASEVLGQPPESRGWVLSMTG